MNVYQVPGAVCLGNVFEFSMRRENEQGYLNTLPIWFYDNTYFVEGIPGRRYTLDVRNIHHASRVEFVVSVDGVDIHDGEDASDKKSGLVIPRHGQWSFEGYRTSTSTVATFRFCAPDGSYGALTGRPKNIGVIGVVAYCEKEKFDYYTTRRSTLKSQMDMETTPLRGGEKGMMSTATRGSSMSSSAPSQSVGTAYGEERHSAVGSTTFVRATTTPNARVVIRYETAEVLERMGIPIHTEHYQAPETGPDPFPASTQKFVPPPPRPPGYVWT